jgi:hypothetical protein
MTADELKAIRDRAKWLEPGHGMIEDPDVARRVAADVSALLAEVERLRAAIAREAESLDRYGSLIDALDVAASLRAMLVP